ncbi:retrovirus-related pol polyprotein from transposon TNT 1-94, partial [Tanacetum coccineum]
MVWGGYAVLMSGKTDSIKLNNNPGCLLESTFVYNKVFKLDFSSASLLLSSSHHPSFVHYPKNFLWKVAWGGYGDDVPRNGNRQNITCWNCNQKSHLQNQCSKLVVSRDKVVNMAAGDSDDALVCCVKNTVEDRIMDSGASFHATYCKEELERFKIRFGKVRLADDKTLDIADVGDVVLKTSFGTSWTLKDVRYFPCLKSRLISVGQLDEEGYHVGFKDQQWKVTKGSLVVARENKRGSLYMVEVHPEGIGSIIDGSGSAALWFGEAEESFLHNVSEDKETAEV